MNKLISFPSALAMLILTLCCQPVFGDPITYQGSLKDSNSAANGTYHFKFAIVSDDRPTHRWSNDSTTTGVPVQNVQIQVQLGVFSIDLGGAGQTPIPADVFSGAVNPRLRIWVASSSSGPFTQLTDQPITASAIAHEALGVKQVNSSATNSIAVWDGTKLGTARGAVLLPDGKMTLEERLTIGSLTPNPGGNLVGDLFLSGTFTTIKFNDQTNVGRWFIARRPENSAGTPGGVNDLKFWRSTGGSNFDTPLTMAYETGYIGIGNVLNPTHPLTVSGSIRLASGGIVFPDGTTQSTAGTGSTIAVGAFGNGAVDSYPNGTFTVPQGTTSVRIDLWGGGGGGATIYGGGGAGGYVRLVAPVTQGEVLGVIVGVGGAVGADGAFSRVYRVSNGQVLATANGGARGTATSGGAGQSGSSAIPAIIRTGGSGTLGDDDFYGEGGLGVLIVGEPLDGFGGGEGEPGTAGRVLIQW